MEYPKFSVLMSLYIKEKAEYFDECMQSILRQTVLPSEIVIVYDGAISDELRKTVEKYKSLHSGWIKTVENEKNKGLYLLLVFGSTVFTRMPGERQYQLEAFWSWKKILHYIEQHGMVTGTGLLRENLLNIVMLFPAGMLLPFVFGNRGKIRWWHGLLFGIFISGCIEGLQLILCRGLFEFDDMIHNSLGCMAGCAIGAGCLKKFNKK